MYGVMDIGSNTIRLVIYRVQDGDIQPLLSTKRAAGLAGYIGKDGVMSPQGIRKAAEVVAEFAQVADNIGVDELFVFATASLRGIVNTDEVTEAIFAASGVRVAVISGQQEALYDYGGATRFSAMTDGFLADVGGGSTELIAVCGGKLALVTSLPVGSLGLYTRHVRHILPDEQEQKQMRRIIREQLRTVTVPDMPHRDRLPLCFIGGTARTVLALAEADHAAHKHRYAPEYLTTLTDRFVEKPRKMTRELLRVAPDRIHTALPGLLILQAVAAICRPSEIITSPYGVREGYLYHVLEERGELHEQPEPVHIH